MKTMKRGKLLPIIAFAVIILLASSLEAVASAAVNMQKDSTSAALPDFLLRLSEYLSKGNSTELARIRHQMIEQEKINQDRIATTNGAVLNGPLLTKSSSSTDSQYPPIYACLTNILYNTSYTIDIYGNRVGHIENSAALTGTYDNNFALLETTGWNLNTNNPIGGEAFAYGQMTGTWASGDIYIQAKIGPNSQSGWQNYVIIETSNNGYNWNYIGYKPVTSSSSTQIYIGTRYASFGYLSVECWTPPPYPIPYSPLVMNSVLVGSVISVNE